MRHILAIFLIFSTVILSAQEISFKHFYKANKSNAEVSLNIPGFIGRAFIPKEDIKEIQELISKTKNLRIMIFSDDLGNREVTRSFKNFVKSNNLEKLIHIKDDKEHINIYTIEKTGFIREIIIELNSGKNEMIILGLRTKITQDELAKTFAENIDIASLNN